MKRFIGALAMAGTLVLATAAVAQYPPPPPGAPPPPPTGTVQQLYAPPQLDQMLASIALYPDPLLTSMLTAATYPLEIVDADRWLASPGNAALSDGALATALEGQNWDPSVKSLVPFPQIVRMMDQQLDWTQAIGNAFLAQQTDVMDSIQRLRHEALAAGTLVSNPDIAISADGPYIEIEPAQPQYVAVPVYNPAVVYGAWPYPAYPPVYYGPPPGIGISATYSGIGFGVTIGVVDVLWNWGRWDWRDHDVRVDPDRFNRIDAGRPPVRATVWQHDPGHRRGVPYADPQSRVRYQKPIPGSPAERRDYRGYTPTPTPSPQRPSAARPAPSPQRGAAPVPGVQPGAPPQREVPPQRGAAPAPAARPVTPPQGQAPPQRGTAPAPAARPVTPPEGQVPPQRGTAPAPAVRPATPPQGQVPQQTLRAAPQQARPVTPPPVRAVQPAPQRPATVFQGIAPGPETRAVSQRGQASRQAATPPPRPQAPAARAAPPPRPQAPAARPQAPAGSPQAPAGKPQSPQAPERRP